MTVAEMAERMSLREYMCWASYFKSENLEHDKTIRKVQQATKSRRRR